MHQNIVNVERNVKSICSRARRKYMHDTFLHMKHRGRLWKYLNNIGVGKKCDSNDVTNFTLNALNESFIDTRMSSPQNNNINIEQEFNENKFFFSLYLP